MIISYINASLSYFNNWSFVFSSEYLGLWAFLNIIQHYAYKTHISASRPPNHNAIFTSRKYRARLRSPNHCRAYQIPRMDRKFMGKLSCLLPLQILSWQSVPLSLRQSYSLIPEISPPSAQLSSERWRDELPSSKSATSRSLASPQITLMTTTNGSKTSTNTGPKWPQQMFNFPL